MRLAQQNSIGHNVQCDIHKDHMREQGRKAHADLIGQKSQVMSNVTSQMTTDRTGRRTQLERKTFSLMTDTVSDTA